MQNFQIACWRSHKAHKRDSQIWIRQPSFGIHALNTKFAITLSLLTVIRHVKSLQSTGFSTENTYRILAVLNMVFIIRHLFLEYKSYY